ncbi:hypothetical protein [Paraburkholderia sp. J10-1]|uniref:hypothetical protein n=1 Tax=Paraburkholderia sp. J10-1 TaxID=2805430 RepID=UPI002AB75327|nr:hypothetical protein [Paraburkholderia sp. J10-1]
MSATPKELVDSATAMLKAATDEAAYRAVCSRAYYGAFHAAKEFHDALATPGSVGNAKGKHEQLIAQLNNPLISRQNPKYLRSIALGKSLRPLIDQRVVADYNLKATVTQAEATTSASNATTLCANATGSTTAVSTAGSQGAGKP